jgi:ribonucleotide reductase alpha subunit
MIYASVEDRSKRLGYIKDWYEAFAKREISKATPHWTGLRFAGNTGSCFVLEVGDSIESIMNNAYRTAQISKDGGGVGTYWGRHYHIRAKRIGCKHHLRHKRAHPKIHPKRRRYGRIRRP